MDSFLLGEETFYVHFMVQLTQVVRPTFLPASPHPMGGEETHPGVRNFVPYNLLA